MGNPYAKIALREAFVSLLNERPFDRIAVVDVVRRAGVSRNTFYYWYCDIYALADDLFMEETQKIVLDEQSFTSWQEAFMHATRFAYRNRRAVYHIYNSAIRSRLEKYLYDVTLNDMTAFVTGLSRGLEVRPEDIRDVAVFYTAALIGLAAMWLDGGMKENPDVYIENLARLLDGNIRASMARSRAPGGGNPPAEPYTSA